MTDPRIKKLAKILVDYSTGVKKGENVYLLTNSFESYPLFEEVYKLVIQRGAYPYPHIGLAPHDPFGKDYIFMKYASEEQLKHLSKITLEEAKKMDVYIRIGADTNTKQLSNIDPQRIAWREKATKPILDERIDNTRWVTTRYPTNAFAGDAEMSQEEFEDFVFEACLVNWQAESKKQDRIKKLFDQGSIVRILGKDTDLSFSILGRLGRKCDGHHNMPDGEVYYAPIENSVEGKITYTYPAIEEGREVSEITLVFKEGEVVEARALKNEEFLKEMLNTDEGARRIGEFGIGTNRKIDRFIKNILFDEKIGGSIHLALGRAYKESGGKNDSAIHWDMIKDLRPQAGGGEIWLDGELVQKDGKWVF